MVEHFYKNNNFGEGWFNYPDLYRDMVSKFGNGSIFVEVGCWKGKSICFLAVEVINSNKDITVYGVDTWKGSAVHQNNPEIINDTLYETFMNNISPVSHIVKPIRMSSLEACKQFKDESLDFVFIDASHEYEDVKKDIDNWLKKVKPGGILAGHDYNWPDVTRAVNEVLGEKCRPVSACCWLYQK